MGKFSGYWSLDRKSEMPLFIITPEAGKYKVSVMFAHDAEPSDSWTASLSNGNLSGANGSTIKVITKGQLKITNYSIEGSDDATLYKINQLSPFFGIWKSSITDKDFLKINLATSAFTSCSGSTKSYHIFLSRNDPNESPYNHQDVCGTNDSIKNKDVTVKYVSNGKVKVTWKEEKMYNKTFTRIYPIASKATSKYNNLNLFWTDFKNAAIKKDYKKMTELTYFPFLMQNIYIYSADFKDFTSDNTNISAIKKAKIPTISSMYFGGGSDINGNMVNVKFNQGSIYEANIGGPTIYFSKINGEFKFIAILYGE